MQQICCNCAAGKFGLTNIRRISQEKKIKDIEIFLEFFLILFLVNFEAKGS